MSVMDNAGDDNNGSNGKVKKKNKPPAPEPTLFDEFETGKELADKIMRKHHPHLLTANVRYICRNKASKKAGKPVAGTVKKNSPKDKHLSGGADFVVDIALEVWNVLEPSQRAALVDHLLTRCQGSEDEETGEMKWSIIPPQVQEFAEVAERHGRWNEDLEQLGAALSNK
jgi:hypothetical protein